MTAQTSQLSYVHRLFSVSCLVLLPLLLVSTSRAQMGGIDPDPGSPGTGGRNTIEGRIYYPSGRNIDKRIRVRLSGLRGDFFALSDDTGAFSFRRVGAGTYVVTVEGGNEYETVREQVDVVDGTTSRGSQGRTFNLQIQLRPKAASATNKSSVIDAALAAVPKPAADLYEKALESERAGDTSTALEQLQRAVALYPEFSLALNEIGNIYQRLGQLDKALEAFGRAVKLAPQVFELRLNYGIVLMRNRQFAEAEAQLRRATELKDASTLAHLYRGKALIQLRKYPEAERELQQVIKLGGDDVAMAYRFLGALYNERGENKLAIEALEKYLSLEPKAKDAESVRQIIKQLRG
jgi:tetratricopeptide (TPR) repeat protein